MQSSVGLWICIHACGWFSWIHVCVYVPSMANASATPGIHYIPMEPCGGHMSLKVAGAAFPTLWSLVKSVPPSLPGCLDGPDDIITNWVRWTPSCLFSNLSNTLSYLCTPNNIKKYVLVHLHNMKEDLLNKDKSLIVWESWLSPSLQSTSNTTVSRISSCSFGFGKSS